MSYKYVQYLRTYIVSDVSKCLHSCYDCFPILNYCNKKVLKIHQSYDCVLCVHKLTKLHPKEYVLEEWCAITEANTTFRGPKGEKHCGQLKQTSGCDVYWGLTFATLLPFVLTGAI